MNSIKSYLSLLNSSLFKDDKDKINEENKTGLELVIIATFIFLSVNMVLRAIVGKVLIHQLTLYLEAGYFLIVFLLYFLVLRKRKLNFTLALYLFEIPVLLIAMFDALYYEPDQTTFIFMIFLLLFPVFILDKTWHIYIFIISMASLYAYFAHAVENPVVYAMDMIHLFNVCLLAIGSSTFFVIVRLRILRAADRNASLAEEDPLTGLYNRSGAEHYVDPKMACIFVYMDLDQFKSVNDQFGHEEGDRILQEAADTLAHTFRKDDVIIRLGGDEFAVWAPGTWTKEEVEKKLSLLVTAIRSIRAYDDQMTASVGCAYAPHGCDSLNTLTRIADEAMYDAKNTGKNGYRILNVE